ILSLKSGIDYVFSGEGERTFPFLAKQILEGRSPKEKIIYGKEVTDLDSIPLPDYRDYKEQREYFHANWTAAKNKYALPYETSRGCWFGKCTFCALNGKKNLIRSKSPAVALQDMKALVERHGMENVVTSDTMMPNRYFRTLIPGLYSAVPGIKVLYEVRADLTLEQAISLKKVSTMLKTGLESLSTSLLKRMYKPYTSRGNITLLRYSRSVGIDLG
ncbi:MAG: hypothetical protein GY950_20315, partial [bacterium]|nr:hypothetical protein [bacterium]